MKLTPTQCCRRPNCPQCQGRGEFFSIYELNRFNRDTMAARLNRPYSTLADKMEKRQRHITITQGQVLKKVIKARREYEAWIMRSYTR